MVHIESESGLIIYILKVKVFGWRRKNGSLLVVHIDTVKMYKLKKNGSHNYPWFGGRIVVHIDIVGLLLL